MTKVPPGLRCLAIAMKRGWRMLFGRAANGMPETILSYISWLAWRILTASPSMRWSSGNCSRQVFAMKGSISMRVNFDRSWRRFKIPRVIAPVPGPSSSVVPFGLIVPAMSLAKALELGATAPIVRGSAISRLSQFIMRQSIAELTLDDNACQRQDTGTSALALRTCEC